MFTVKTQVSHLHITDRIRAKGLRVRDLVGPLTDVKQHRIIPEDYTKTLKWIPTNSVVLAPENSGLNSAILVITVRPKSYLAPVDTSELMEYDGPAKDRDDELAKDIDVGRGYWVENKVLFWIGLPDPRMSFWYHCTLITCRAYERFLGRLYRKEWDYYCNQFAYRMLEEPGYPLSPKEVLTEFMDEKKMAERAKKEKDQYRKATPPPLAYFGRSHSRIIDLSLGDTRYDCFFSAMSPTNFRPFWCVREDDDWLDFFNDPTATLSQQISSILDVLMNGLWCVSLTDDWAANFRKNSYNAVFWTPLWSKYWCVRFGAPWHPFYTPLYTNLPWFLNAQNNDFCVFWSPILFGDNSDSEWCVKIPTRAIPTIFLA